MKKLCVLIGLLISCYGIAAQEALIGTVQNVSIRGEIAHKPLIQGFVVEGKRLLLVRGVGPGLKRFDVDDAVADPRLTLHDSKGEAIFAGVSVKALDDEQWSLLVDIQKRAGAFPLDRNSEDVVLLLPWSGLGTLHAESLAGGSGEILVECYSVSVDSFDETKSLRYIVAHTAGPILE